jgi:UDP-4-amino-4,6-dideoxy-N-acetyl-beta-L-altrosamine transaminase
MIPYGRQDISDRDIQAVVDILKSDWLTQGPAVERFETAVSHYCGAPYAVAVSSATAALHLACLAAGLGPGDILWTSPNSFVASANCALYCGASVDFVDIEPATGNLSVAKLEEKLVEAQRQNSLPKVVVPVHFAGQPCDMAPVAELARRYGFVVIEDASHAIGASYQGVKIGNCTHADFTVFSFHPVKIVTTGEGGMVLTRSAEHYQRLLRLRSHGITRDPVEMVGPSEGPWYYQQVELGFNYRITDIQCALGASQMARLDDFVARRAALAERYRQKLSGLPLRVLEQRADRTSAWHLFVVCLKLDELTVTRREVFEGLRKAGIGVNVHYIPIHAQPHYQRLGFHHGDFPAAEQYYREALTLPLYPGLDEADQDKVVSVLAEALQ